MLQAITLILFFYVFILAAIVLTYYVVMTAVRFIREGTHQKGNEKP